MPDDPWFEFKIEGAELAAGVDPLALASTIRDLMAALRTAAALRLGIPDRRRGRISPAERALASIVITGVHSSSVALEFAPPSSTPFSFTEDGLNVEAADVVRDLLADITTARTRGVAAIESHRRRDAVARLFRSSARIGPSVTVTLREDTTVQQAFVVFDQAGDIPREPERRSHEAVLLGHVYMIDVEPGRQRLRLKLVDESDVTVVVGDELAATLTDIADRLARVTVLEVWDDDVLLERTALRAELLDPDVVETRPKRTLYEIAASQGLLFERPDYAALADALWETPALAAGFRLHVRKLRAPAA